MERSLSIHCGHVTLIVSDCQLFRQCQWYRCNKWFYFNKKGHSFSYEAFTAKNPDVTVTYDATGSGAGIITRFRRSSDIDLCSQKLRDSKTDLDTTIVSLDGITSIVNNANIVQGLTIKQIAGLFTGESTNWNEVGGADAPVAIIGHEGGFGTRGGFERILVEQKSGYTIRSSHRLELSSLQ